MTSANDYTWEPVKGTASAQHARIDGVDYRIAGVKDCPVCGEDHPDVVELEP